MLLSGWAWHVICAPDIFSWNFSFLVLNIGQLVYIVYQMRPVRFDPELEEAYHTLFYPFKVSTFESEYTKKQWLLTRFLNLSRVCRLLSNILNIKLLFSCYLNLNMTKVFKYYSANKIIFMMYICDGRTS